MILTQAAAANVWDFVVLVAGFDQSYDCKLSKKGKCRGFVGPTSLLPLPSGGSHVESNGRRLVAGKRGKAESHISIRFISAFEACRSMGSRTTVVSSPCATWAGKQPDRPTLNKKSEALGGHPNLSKVLPGCQHQRPQASHIPYPIEAVKWVRGLLLFTLNGNRRHPIVVLGNLRIRASTITRLSSTSY